ncbi:polyketide cyclase [Nocardioides phosphati]|uniref:Polyketide cyclase n=1 Tax=Nocardioides phosphati TaxID=1867775 RepID=A0ABQ2N6L2_9ACTN|nr:SRPBCC family protein [Nocardioides phosphati]GGO84520.1 polyketide cyclase [Nocardioides phosphati]
MRRYEFAADWRLPHAPAVVHGVLEDVEHYPSWWPQVVACLKLGEDEGVVLCRSALPYTLELRIGLLRRTPEVLESRVTGDLDGWVRWRVVPEEDGCRVHFEQEVVVRGRLLSLGSYVARPLLNWNHHVMLEGARAGLERHLAR